MMKLQKKIVSNYGLLIILIIAVIFGGVWNSAFLSLQNIRTMLLGRVTVGFLAIAMVIIMSSGEMDISVGYMLGATVMIAAKVGKMGADPVVIILVALLSGVVFGAMNGLLTMVIKIPSTISTLGSGMVMYGISSWTNNSLSITSVMPKVVTKMFKAKYFGFNPCIWAFFVVVILAYWLLEFTPLGGQIYAVGFSKRVSHLAGIRTKLVKFLAFTFGGASVGVAGALLIAQSGNAYITTGPMYLMPCLAVTFLSITTHRIGRYNIPGMLVGLLLLGVVYNIAGLMGAPFWFENVMNGIVILGVVLTNGKNARAALSG